MQMMPKWIHRQGRLALLSPVAFGLLTISKSAKGCPLSILYEGLRLFLLSCIRHLLSCIGQTSEKNRPQDKQRQTKKADIMRIS